MMGELGARLFAIWESTPYNGHWPQVTIIWEIDGFADYARIGAAQAPGGSHEVAAGKWSEFLARVGASGEGRIMYPGPSNKTLAPLPDWLDSERLFALQGHALRRVLEPRLRRSLASRRRTRASTGPVRAVCMAVWRAAVSRFPPRIATGPSPSTRPV
jgi:hypothetical protein